MHMFNSRSSLDPLLDRYGCLTSRLRQIRPQLDPWRAPAIAITSYEADAGVSSVTNALTVQMNSSPKALRLADVTISLSPDEVCKSSSSSKVFWESLFARHAAALEHVFDAADEEPSSTICENLGSTTNFEEILSAARSLFRFVLVECSPLRASSDIAILSPLVDGVIIVVEANRTTGPQLERMANSIQIAGGTILGYVLNKQTFPIPNLIDQALEKVGVI